MTLTTKDASILAQVAFKAAVEVATAANLDLLTTEGDSTFDATLVVLSEKLFTTVSAAMAAAAPTPTTVPVPERSVEQALTQELGATVSIEVVSEGGQQGAFPAWFIRDAAEHGTSRVYDNRAGLAANSKLPWFKDADDKHPFWPPKGGKGRG